MNRKHMPALFMLTAAAVMCIITFIMDFSIIGKLLSLLLVMIVFGALGYVLKWTLDLFEKQNKALEQEKKVKELAELTENAEKTDGAEGDGDTVTAQ